jgi:arylamine N-acetyltransferase
MGDNNQSRRDFLHLNFIRSNEDTSHVSPVQKVKMLTPDGKLVEIDKELLDQVTKKKKATNKEIYDWMKNPSKEDTK